MHVKNEERTSSAASALGTLNDLIKLRTRRHETFGKNVVLLRESLSHVSEAAASQNSEANAPLRSQSCSPS